MALLREGQVFAGFVILGQLGSGGMGEVYLATHPRLPRPEALKLLSAEASVDDAYRQRFNREADLAARLFHPNIVGVHDRGEFNGQLWISMDYIAGTDVPANVLLADPETPTQRIFLADFGIARQMAGDSNLTSTGMMVGTMSSGSPEQMAGNPLAVRPAHFVAPQQRPPARGPSCPDPAPRRVHRRRSTTRHRHRRGLCEHGQRTPGHHRRPAQCRRRGHSEDGPESHRQERLAGSGRRGQALVLGRSGEGLRLHRRRKELRDRGRRIRHRPRQPLAHRAEVLRAGASSARSDSPVGDKMSR